MAQDTLREYQKAVALAQCNYTSRLTEAQRLMGEARTIYDDDLKKARGLLSNKRRE